MPEYLADAYALIELSRGNPAYASVRGARLLTTVFGNTEAFFVFLKEGDGAAGARRLVRYQAAAQPVTASIIANAMRFRLEHKRESLSYADCIGYATARELGIPFLTGDKGFKGKDGVVFIT